MCACVLVCLCASVRCDVVYDEVAMACAYMHVLVCFSAMRCVSLLMMYDEVGMACACMHVLVCFRFPDVRFPETPRGPLYICVI